MRHTTAPCIALLCSLVFCCPAQAETLHISHLTGEAGWEDILQLDNGSDETVTCELTLRDASGRVLPIPLSRDVPPGGYETLDLTTLAPTAETGTLSCAALPARQAGQDQAESSLDERFQARIAYKHHTGGGVAEFLLTDEAAASLHFPFANFADFVDWKGIAVANVSDTDVDLVVTALGQASELASRTVALPARTRMTRYAAQLFPTLKLAAIQRISVRTANGLPVLSGLAISGETSGERLLFGPAKASADAAEAATGSFYIPHVTGGEPWRDVLQVDNLGSQVAWFRYQVLNSEGDNLFMPQTVALSPGEYTALDLKNRGEGGAMGFVYYSGDLAFRMTHENLAGGGVAEFALAEELETTLTCHFANFSEDVEWKGLAVMNTGHFEAAVTATANGADGPLATRMLIIAPGQKFRALTTEETLFPGVAMARILRITLETKDAVLNGVSMSGNWAGTRLFSSTAR